ncbi:MAG: hypothetical protein LBH77_09285 [Tannerella sp.]|jgi:hypothetical protein|nr:hypothetical protein [Tannerella sp.]
MNRMNKKKRNSLMYYLGASVLKDFVVKHTKMIMLIVILLFLYISNRYACGIKRNEISFLQEELRMVKFEAQAISARLTGYTRPSQVEELVKQQGLDLKKAKTPPYKLRK